MTGHLTIAIAARNAEATIERAVRSCAAEANCPILLIDDHSTDATVARARGVLGSRLWVLRARDPGGVPVARQCGLEAIQTELGAWLDADDEWIPGRAKRLVAMLENGCDVAVDAFDLHDGTTGAWRQRLTAPTFLRGRGGTLRLFERNWLPGDSPVGFRLSVFREAGGYDPAIYGPESYDLLLRAIVRGARFGWSDEIGYRLYTYAGSVSRNLTRQRAALAAALRKHDYERLRAMYADAGFAPRIGAWALVSVALFRDEAAAALRFLDEASPAHADPEEILEPDGPWPFREGWRRAFARGAGLLLAGGRDGDALAALRDAEAMEPTAEGANNLGVALWRLGCHSEAQECWATAAARFPDFADARANSSSQKAERITTHPLRRLASRNDYL